jgi:hypothetical protein
MLMKVKLLLGLTDDSKDDLLTILIDVAIDEALAYTHRECINGLETSIIQMVVYKYNRIGTEGVESENYSGVSFAYTADYPDNILRGLKAKRKVVVL